MLNSVYFNLGKVIVTNTINNSMIKDKQFKKEVINALCSL